MWLPKEERKLLVIYTNKILKEIEKMDSAVTNEKWYPVGDIVEEFQAKDCVKRTENIKEYSAAKAAVDAANNALVARSLIRITPHQTQPRIGVSLTIEGYDLGRKYAHWFTLSGLCFKEYKDHWIWLILSFILGVLTTLLVK